MDIDQIELDDMDLVGRLRALCKCAASDDARPVLASVLFEPDGEDGAVAVATDSHVLAWVKLPDVKLSGPVLLEAQELEKALRQASAARDKRHRVTTEPFDPVTVNVAAGSVSVQALSMSVRKIEGRFPDWRQLIGDSRPDDGEAVPVFDASKLARVAACTPTKTSNGLLVKTVWRGGLRPIHVQDADGETFGLVMPVEV